MEQPKTSQETSMQVQADKKMQSDDQSNVTIEQQEGVIASKDNHQAKKPKMEQEVNGSKQKMNHAEQQEGEEEEDEGNDRKRKRAILFGYSGAGFSGLQTQQGAVVHMDWEAEAHKDPNDTTPDTVEDALFRALCLVGSISDTNRESFQKVGWTRSARTDRGVHAASQVVAAKLIIPNCKETRVGGDISRKEEEAFVGKLNAQLPSSIRVYRCIRVTQGFNARKATSSRTYGYFLPEFALKRPDGTLPEMFELRQALKMFEGSHLFHNFTEKLSPKDPRARRVIESFIASEPFELEGGEDPNRERIIRLQVKGQSFLKHHIRRMVGFVVECLRRGLDVKENLQTALSEDRVLPSRRIDYMPMAPAEGLFLDIAYFDFYNAGLAKVAQQQGTELREPIDFVADASVRLARENLIQQVILPAIFEQQQQEKIGSDEKRRGGALGAFDKWIKERDQLEFPPYLAELDMPQELQDAEEFLRLVEKNRLKRVKGFGWIKPQAAASSSS